MLPTINRLDELVDLVREHSDEDLFVRWSAGPDADRYTPGDSRDDLTGVPLPGLSVNPLRVEPWWGNRSPRLWLARRLFDYRHLRELRGPDVRPWVLAGVESGRGPDNEPLVTDVRPLAWIAEAVLDECERMIKQRRPVGRR